MLEVKPLRSRLGVVALAAALLSVTPGAKSACVPTHRADLPIHMDQRLPIVSVLINGHSSKLILDTGAEQTVIGQAAAQALGVQVHQEYPKSMRGLNGTFRTGKVDVTVSAGEISLTRRGVLVGPLSLPPLGYVTPDGLLGADILSEFEVDLDLAHEQMHLYESPPSCVITSPSWPRPYDVIAASRSLHEHLFFPLTLDGSKLAGFFDSGSVRSILDKAFVEKTGDAGTIVDDTANVRGVTAGQVSATARRFQQLVIGAEKLSNPALVIAALNLDDANIIIGMDYLRWHRIWLSYSSHQVFVRGPDPVAK